MKLNHTIVWAAALLVIVSCARLEPMPEEASSEGEILSLTAEWADAGMTKTAIQEDGTSVWWSAAEEISVFSNMGAARFVSTNTEPAASVTFTGRLAISSGNDDLWAIYPYTENNNFDGQSLILTVPTQQTASAGTFADGLFPAIAKANGTSLSFYNVCGGAVFSVVTEGVRYVTFRSMGGESLVGTVSVGFDKEGFPEIRSLSNGSDTVVLTPPDGDTFEVGKKYYAVFLPMSLQNGLTVTVQTDTQEATMTKDGPIQIHRSLFGRLMEVDKGLDFGGLSTIPFADKQLEAVLVGHFDTDGDGALSPEEAAAVTSLVEVFPQGSIWDPVTYTSFDEFRWFTGVTEIPESCFAYWTQLQSITLPESLTAIRRTAFLRCGNLTEIQIPDQVETIEFEAFSATGITSVNIPESVTSVNTPFLHCSNLSEITGKGATADHRGLVFADRSGKAVFEAIAPAGLTEYDIPKGVEVIGDWVFTSCDKLTRIGIPNGVTRIERAAFHGCEALAAISIPEGVTFLGDYVFRECSSLQRLELPSTITSVGDIELEIWDPVSGCSSLTGFYGKYASEDHRSLIVDDVYVAFALASGSDPLEIPEGIQIIGEGALSNASLDGIEIPGGVTTISINAFASSTIPIVVVPETVTSLKDQAFVDFRGSIFFERQTPPAVESNIFYDNSKCRIYVPAAALDTYKSADGWTGYANLILPAPVTATCAEVIAGADATSYMVTGTCVRIANTNYGNWYLEDATGQIYIYGSVTAAGAYNWPSFGIGIGDQVTVIGPKTTYNGITELVDARVVKVQKALLTVEEAPALIAATGGEVSVTLLNRGGEVSVMIPEEDQSWLSLEGVSASPTNGRTVLTFSVLPNVGVPRDTDVSFTSATDYQETILHVVFTQSGSEGTVEAPFTVEQAIAFTNDAGGACPIPVYIQGVVSKVEAGFTAETGYAVFWISSDGIFHNDVSLDFEAFRVRYLDNKSWSAGDAQIGVGDKVTLYGPTTLYRGFAEIPANSGWVYRHDPLATAPSPTVPEGGSEGTGTEIWK